MTTVLSHPRASYRCKPQPNETVNPSHSPAMLFRLQAKVRALLVASLVLLPVAAFAQTTWYLNTSQPFGIDWNAKTYWSANADGTGSNPASISNQDIFNTNSKTLRTYSSTSTVPNGTFGGSRLDLNSQLSLKASIINIGNLKTLGGAYITAQDADGVNDKTLILNVTSFNSTAETRFSATIANSRTLAVNITTLTGTGDFVFGKTAAGTLAASALTFQATTATNFTGNIYLFGSGSTLAFTQNLTTGGELHLETGSILTLNRNLTFTGLSIGGTALAAGQTYTFSQLNTSYDAYFSDIGSGSITILAIPEPSTYAALLAAFAGAVAMGRRRSRA